MSSSSPSCDPPHPPPRQNQSDPMTFLLSQKRKEEIYNTTILNIDRTITNYMETLLKLKRERLENQCISQLKGKVYEEDEEAIQRMNELDTWVAELKELKQTIMMNWLGMEQGETQVLM